MTDVRLIQSALRAAITEIENPSNEGRRVLHMLARALDEAAGIEGIIEEIKRFRFTYGKERRP